MRRAANVESQDEESLTGSCRKIRGRSCPQSQGSSTWTPREKEAVDPERYLFLMVWFMKIIVLIIIVLLQGGLSDTLRNLLSLDPAVPLTERKTPKTNGKGVSFSGACMSLFFIQHPRIKIIVSPLQDLRILDRQQWWKLSDMLGVDIVNTLGERTTFAHCQGTGKTGLA